MKVFHHNDLDGRCAGAIVSNFRKNKNPADFFEVDYSKPWPIDKVQDGEEVWFVDLSFKENTVWQLEELKKRNCSIIWCDHHTSSINLINQPGYEWLKKIDGIVCNGISGAALTYMYVYEMSFEEIPYYVKLVSDYDCWQFKYDPHTTHFKLVMDTMDDGALDSIWGALEDRGGSLLVEMLNKGESIHSYIKQDNKFYRDTFAYESEIAGHKCLVVNKKTNSWVFGEKFKQYPICIVWVFDGENYSYSIYSSDENIDCSKIAESYGGGGHRQAAGFVSKELYFKKV